MESGLVLPVIPQWEQIKLERQGGEPSKTLEAKLKNVGSFWVQWETTKGFKQERDWGFDL